MAVVFSNNATTVLSSNITNSATSIAVQDGSVFPTLSGTDYFYATLQDPGNTKREIVKVTARSGNTLTVTRAVDGSSASAFSANDAFELRLNAAALNDAVNSGTADLELNSFTGDGSEVDFTLSMEALEANTLVYIDGVYQNKTAYSISGYVLTFSAAPDNGAAIEVTTATVAPIQESTDFLLNQFTGDGSDTTFTLSSSPEENQTTVFISGVYQSKSNYSISGTTLTFSTAPPASSSIEVMVARTVVYGIGTPSNDTVSTAKIVDGAVTPAKLSLTYATETFVGTAVSNLVDSSPAALDTLNELAAALGDDPNFATTVTNSIALKAPLASPSFTGTATVVGTTTSGILLKSASGASNGFKLYNDSGTDTAYLNNHFSGPMVFATNNTERLRIDSAGNTFLQTGGAALQWQNGYQTITGDAASNDLTYRTYANHIWKTTTGASSTTDGTERMRIDSAGNVDLYQGKNLTWRYAAGSTIRGSISVDSADNITFSNTSSNTERMRIDSAGNLTTRQSTGNNFRVIRNGDNSIEVGNYNATDGYQNTSYVSSTHTFYAGTAGAGSASRAVDIDSSGRLLVGTTDSNVYNDATGTGTVIQSNGIMQLAANNGTPLYANRQGNDGDIIDFRKNGTPVGSIQSRAGVVSTIILDPRSGSLGTGITGSGSNLSPTNGSGTEADARNDIGTSTYRFKDLYLSGGTQSAGSSTFTGATPMSFNKAGSDTYTKTVLYDSQNNTANSVFSGLTLEMGRLTNSGTATPRTFTITDRGATNRWCFSQYGLSFNPTNGVASAAESLDSYEEGTWTPVIKEGNGSGTTLALSFSTGSYTKIGNTVTITGYIIRNDTTSLTGAMVISNLPFTQAGGPQTGGSIWVDNASSDVLGLAYGNNGSLCYWRSIADPNDYIAVSEFENLRSSYFSRTYITT